MFWIVSLSFWIFAKRWPAWATTKTCHAPVPRIPGAQLGPHREWARLAYLWKKPYMRTTSQELLCIDIAQNNNNTLLIFHCLHDTMSYLPVHQKSTRARPYWGSARKNCCTKGRASAVLSLEYQLVLWEGCKPDTQPRRDCMSERVYRTRGESILKQANSQNKQ